MSDRPATVTTRGVTYCGACYGQINPPGKVGCACGMYGVPMLPVLTVIWACVFAVLLVLLFGVVPYV